MKRTFCCLVLACAFVGADVPWAAGQDADAGVEGLNVGVRVEHYELDHGVVHALVTAPSDRTDATELREAVLERVAAGEAELVESLYSVGRSAERCRTGSVTEWIYPIEFDPPETVATLAGPIEAGVDLMAPITATAFKTRHVGPSLEVEAVVGPEGDRVDLLIASEIVVHLGESVLGRDESSIKQPVFHSMKVDCSLTLASGTWAVLGVHAPPPDGIDAEPAPDRRILSLVRVDVLRPPPEIEPPAPDAPSQVALVCEWFELGAGTATGLLDSQAGSAADATPLRDAVLALRADGSASLLESALLLTRSGQEARSESVKEWIGPIEMDPPELPQTLTGPIDPAVDITTHLSYTAFDTRKVGTILQATPVIEQDRSSIDIDLATEIVRLGAIREIGRDESLSEHPIYFTLHDQVAVRVVHGTTLLVGMHSPMPDDVTGPYFGSERRILVFLTARILTVN